MGKPLSTLNFHHSHYSREMKKLEQLGKEAVIASYRKQGDNSEDEEEDDDEDEEYDEDEELQN